MVRSGLGCRDLAVVPRPHPCTTAAQTAGRIPLMFLDENAPVAVAALPMEPLKERAAECAMLSPMCVKVDHGAVGGDGITEIPLTIRDDNPRHGFHYATASAPVMLRVA